MNFGGIIRGKQKSSGSVLCCFLGQDGDFEDLLPSSSFSTLLDAQGFSDLEKNLSPTPVRGSPSHDPFNTSAPEEVFTDLLFLHVKKKFNRLENKDNSCANVQILKCPNCWIVTAVFNQF